MMNTAVTPLVSAPWGGLFISNTFEGVELNRDGDLFQGGGGYLNLANMH